METTPQVQTFWAAQFETQAQNGLIRLPAGYPELANATLRVLVLSAAPTKIEADTAAQAQRLAKREKLLAAFEHLKEINPFRTIADPIEWQREQREDRVLLGRE